MWAEWHVNEGIEPFDAGVLENECIEKFQDSRSWGMDLDTAAGIDQHGKSIREPIEFLFGQEQHFKATVIILRDVQFRNRE